MNHRDDFLMLENFPVSFIDPARDRDSRIEFGQLMGRWNKTGPEIWELMKTDLFQATVNPFFISCDCEGYRTPGNLWFDLEEVVEFETLFRDLLRDRSAGECHRDEPTASVLATGYNPCVHAPSPAGLDHDGRVTALIPSHQGHGTQPRSQGEDTLWPGGRQPTLAELHDDQQLTTKQAAKLLCMSRNVLSEKARKGEIGFIKVHGRGRSFTVRHLRAYLSSKTHDAKAPGTAATNQQSMRRTRKAETRKSPAEWRENMKNW